jgi:hypothetical protein
MRKPSFAEETGVNPTRREQDCLFKIGSRNEGKRQYKPELMLLQRRQGAGLQRTTLEAAHRHSSLIEKGGADKTPMGDEDIKVSLLPAINASCTIARTESILHSLSSDKCRLLHKLRV